MARWTHLWIAPAVIMFTGCIDGLPTDTSASPDAVEEGIGDQVGVLAPAVEEADVVMTIDIKPDLGTGDIRVTDKNRLAIALFPNDAYFPLENVHGGSLQLELYDDELDPDANAVLDPMHDLERGQAFASHLKYDELTGELLYLVVHFDPMLLPAGQSYMCLTGTATSEADEGEDPVDLSFAGCDMATVRG